MTSLGILLRQIKEKEEHDLEYARKIKEAETLIKSEQDTLKKLKRKKEMLKQAIKRKQFTCSEREISKVLLVHQKCIWEDMFEEAQKDLKEHETLLDELQQSVCSDRLALCDDVKEFLVKSELNIISKNSNSSTFPAMNGTLIKIEPEEDDHENLEEEIILLENQLAELHAEAIQIEEVKRQKVHLEAEPSCGDEFLQYQSLLKDAKESLRKTEDEVAYLKMQIGQKELLLVKKKGSQICEENPTVFSQSCQEMRDPAHSHSCQEMRDPAQSLSTQGNSSTSKTVTFNTRVEMKAISPRVQNKITPKCKDRTKTPSPALRKKLAKQLTPELDQTMRDILFKENV